MTTCKPKILVIDDDAQIRQALRAILTAKQYQVVLAASGEEGVSLAVDEKPALVILDLSMPGLGGLDVCQTLRAWYHNPILVLSVIEREADKIAAFARGADDYVTKPFSIGELLARIEAHLRRMQSLTAAPPPAALTVGELHIDQVHRRVHLAGSELKLTPIEYEILVLLAHTPDCVVTYRMLLEQIWGEGTVEDPHLLRVHMSNLRRKLGETPWLQTEQGLGYRLISS